MSKPKAKMVSVTLPPPQVPGGEAATVALSIVRGRIVAITVTNPGNGYTSQPRLPAGWKL